MVSEHGWTMLKPQPDSSSTTYYYVHPGDLDTPDGDSNVHSTRIKLSNGIVPSHIKVAVVPKTKVIGDRWPLILFALLLLTNVLLALVFLELKATKEELKTLQAIVKNLGKRNTDEVQMSRLSLNPEVTDRNIQPILKSDVENIGLTTVPPPPSSTERDKREAPIEFPLLAHYKGGLPESVIAEGAGDFDGGIGCPGLISPWFKDKLAAGEFVLRNTTAKRGSVQVPESGLYFIYAQVFYLTRNVSNSYSITLTHDTGHDTILATCSSPPNDQAESSCYTATARALKKGDWLQLKQRERNRHILLRQGQTFLGLVLLSPSPSSL